jgi:hypothetical protein
MRILLVIFNWILVACLQGALAYRYGSVLRCTFNALGVSIVASSRMAPD